MVDKEKYFDYLYEALASNKLVPNADLWRIDNEDAVRYLNIDRSILDKLKEKYHAQFADVVLINAKKNILASYDYGIKVSRQLSAASVYFSLLGCLLDYFLDSGNQKLVEIAESKLSWDFCSQYFEIFSINNVNDEIEWLFVHVSEGLQRIAKNNNRLYLKIIELLKISINSEINVSVENSYASQKDIYNKSVLFSQIAFLIALGEKRNWDDDDYHAIKNVGYLYAILDDLIDIYEDETVHQLNIISKKLNNGLTHEIVVDNAIQEINRLLIEIRKRFSKEFVDLIYHELAEWIYSNNELTRRHYEHKGDN